MATAVGRRYGDEVEHVVDLERAQPAAVPDAAVPQGQARTRRGSTAQLYQAGVRGPASDAGQPQRHDPDRRDLAARQLERRLPARLLAAGCCAWTRRTARRSRAASSTPTATPTTRTRPPRARASCRTTRDDVTIGVLSRLERALDRAGKAGGAAARAADLPDRVRDPVAAGPASRASRFAKQAAYLVDRRAHGLRQPARALVLAVPDERRPAARLGATGTPASRAACARARARRSRPTRRFRLPLAVENYGAHATCCGASCARTARRPQVTIEVDPRGKKRLAQARRRQDDGHRRLLRSRDAPQGPALPRQVDRAGRQALHRRRRARVLSRPGHPS